MLWRRKPFEGGADLSRLQHPDGDGVGALDLGIGILPPSSPGTRRPGAAHRRTRRSPDRALAAHPFGGAAPAAVGTVYRHLAEARNALTVAARVICETLDQTEPHEGQATRRLRSRTMRIFIVHAHHGRRASMARRFAQGAGRGGRFRPLCDGLRPGIGSSQFQDRQGSRAAEATERGVAASDCDGYAAELRRRWTSSSGAIRSSAVSARWLGLPAILKGCRPRSPSGGPTRGSYFNKGVLSPRRAMLRHGRQARRRLHWASGLLG